MGQRVGQRRPGEEEERLADEPQAPAKPAEQLIALQRSAGNRAVTAMLGREATAEPADTRRQPARTGRYAVLEGIGTIPLLSASLDTARMGGSGSGGRSDKLDVKEIHLSSAVGPHSPDLDRAASAGPPMDVEIVLGPKVRLKLKGALISSYSASAEVESWSLNFASIRVVTEGDGKDDDPGGARRDRWELGGA